MTNSTEKKTTQFARFSKDTHPLFHALVLPILFICSIFLAILAFYARIKCTDRNFAWGAVPKLPFGRVDPSKVFKEKEAEAGIDYTIVQGTKEEPVVFALAETLKPLNEIERQPDKVVDEGTQYESSDVPK